MTDATRSTRGQRGTLLSVLDAVVAGGRTVDELARATGLDVDLVRLALDRLVGLGRISSDQASSCLPAHCSGCAEPTGVGCTTGRLITLSLNGPAPVHPR